MQVSDIYIIVYRLVLRAREEQRLIFSNNLYVCICLSIFILKSGKDFIGI